MEKYRPEFGFYDCERPLSLTARRIMAALKSQNPAACEAAEKGTHTGDKFQGSVIQEDYHPDVKRKDIHHQNHFQEEEYRDSLDGTNVNILRENKMRSSSREQVLSDVLPGKSTCTNVQQTKNAILDTVTDPCADTSKNKEGIDTLLGKKITSNILAPKEFTLTEKRAWEKEVTPVVGISSAIKISAREFQEHACFSSDNSEKGYNHVQKRHPAPQKPKSCFPESNFRDEIVGNADPEIHNIGSVDEEQQGKVLEDFKQASAFILTIVFQDGSTQLSASKDVTLPVKGIILMIKRQGKLSRFNSNNNEKFENVEEEKYVYMATGENLFWKKDEAQHKFYRFVNLFFRKLLLSILQSSKPVICFNAKDFLRTVLCERNISWKRVLKSVVFDPRIAAWLLNQSDSNPSFEELVNKYCGELNLNSASNASGSSHRKIGLQLTVLFALMKNMQSKLQEEGLWSLFCSIELPLISILAVMESHRIQVNQDELKKTSELLGAYLKELEQEAHRAAGERFRLTSAKELREILFDKLRLHLQCKAKLRHFPSTAESVLHQLQELHPLPKIILEFRQMQKIKSTFLDGLLSCMTKGFVSSTWNQTGTVSGRLSAKHPNIQGVPKLPVQILKPQYIQGKERESITINPRSMFTSGTGCAFLAADFSQIELRIIAHFSSDPELLRLFQENDSTDVFTKLASQWKDVSAKDVTHSDREQAKRVAYSVIYGAGKERLSECLGISLAEANAFIERFLQKYKVSDFIQRVIQHCHSKGFVTSLMGRKRHLPQINAHDYALRAQAERQAVNFVVQGSAADLCKMAMIKISAATATSPWSTARLIAQIHDELLFEVEEPQIHEFAALVKEIMESLQHAEGVELKVPLKVVLTAGRSWGCMAGLQALGAAGQQPHTSQLCVDSSLGSA
ncbi:DNA polymerase nu [Spea bombifrons]|uniref:DNA polymerase nu n=1 Tax=Spea bombifrons TaxID=233779 RepID=UPI00234B932D|nr:DNA polymerase nu [Spea bombifrons]